MKYISLVLLFSSLFSSPNDPLIKASLAMRAGLYREALFHVAKAKEMDQKNPEVYRLKAMLHEALNEPDNAVHAWKQCLTYSNDKLLTQEAKIHIDSLTKE